MAFDAQAIRRQFPFFEQERGIYLDSAATTQKPQCVLDAMTSLYTEAGNPHRGMHKATEQATEHYEQARRTVQKFLNAAHPDEIIFTKNATEAINLVMQSWAKANVNEGEGITITMMEHHSNTVPWLMLKEQKQTEVYWIACDAEGTLNMHALTDALQEKKVKLVAITGQSNVLGVQPDLATIIPLAHEHGALVLVDAAQLIAHAEVDVQALDADFLVFSGHKLYGPSGIGVLYAKRELLRDMPPFLGGGMMIHEVTQHGFTPADPPQRFEAGTMPAAEAGGLASAIEWLTSIPFADRQAHEHGLIAHAHAKLSTIEGVKILGPGNPDAHHGVLSFVIDGIHAHDLTDLLGERGFALRAGHHCAQPLHDALGIAASSRLSVALYNTKEEIDALVMAILDIQKKFS